MAITGNKPLGTVTNPSSPEILSLPDLNKALQDAYDQSVAARKRIPATLENSLRSAQKADTVFAQELNAFQLQAEQATQRARTAHDRLVNLAQNPDVFNRFMGMFDPNYNPQSQMQILQREQLNLQSASTNLRTAATTRDLIVSNAQRSQQAATEFYQFNRQGFLDTASMVQFGFQVREGVRKELVDFVQEQPKDKLASWFANPSSIPAKLKGHEGLIEAELFNKKAQDANLQSVQLSNRMQNIRLQDQMKQEYFAQFGDISEVQGAAKGKHPDFIKSNDFNDEINRRTDVMFKLETARTAMEAGQLGMAQAYKAQAMLGATEADITSAITRLKETGSSEVFIGGVPFKLGELQTALVGKQKQRKEQESLLVDHLTAIAKLEENVNGALTTATRVGSLLNPTGDPIAGIPNDMMSEIKTAQNIQDSLKPLMDNGSSEAALKTAAVWEATAKDIEEKTNDIIKNQYVKQQQPAAHEYVAGDGTINNANNAAAFLLNEAGNEFALDNDPIMRDAWRLFSSRLAEISTSKKVSFNVSEDGQSLLLGGQDDIELTAMVNQAVNESEARKLIADNAFQEVLTQGAISLVQETSQITAKETPLTTATPQQNLFSELVNPLTGKLSRRFYRTEAKDGRQVQIFEPMLFMKELARIETQAREQKLISPDQSIADILFTRVNEFIPELVQRFRTNINASALNKAAFNNNPLPNIYGRMAEIEAQMPQMLQNVQANVDALKNTLQQQMPALSEPGMAP